MRTLASVLLAAVCGLATSACDHTVGKQVIVLGDSYLHAFDPFAMAHTTVETLARQAGGLEASDSYRFYAFPGTAMLNGTIPNQLTQAIAQDPDIKLVIMTGGGNDVLVSNRQCLVDGSASNPVCQKVVADSTGVARQMMDRAADTGVEDVIYFFYPHIVPGGLGGSDPNEILDYSVPIAKAACDGAAARTGGRLRCHFIDLRPVFAGKEATYIKGDGVHPTAEGARAIGTAIFNVMRANCLPTSGCEQH